MNKIYRRLYLKGKVNGYFLRSDQLLTVNWNVMKSVLHIRPVDKARLWNKLSGMDNAKNNSHVNSFD